MTKTYTSETLSQTGVTMLPPHTLICYDHLGHWSAEARTEGRGADTSYYVLSHVNMVRTACVKYIHVYTDRAPVRVLTLDDELPLTQPMRYGLETCGAALVARGVLWRYSINSHRWLLCLATDQYLGLTAFL